MKVCKFCNTENSDDTAVCNSCGGNEFSFVCPNCGNVHDYAYCPNCGTKRGESARTCPSCGEKYFNRICPNCGYMPGSDAVTVTVRERIITETEEPKKKRSGWATFGLILLWIYFLPIMATIKVWKSEKLPKWAKIVITVAIWIFVAILFLQTSI